MQISKSKIIKTICFFIVLLLCITTVNFLLVPYSSMMKRFRGFNYDRNSKTIQALVLGSSEEYDGFDADLMTEELGLSSAVFCVQGGLPQTSYYCLLDALKNTDLKLLIVGYSMLENLKYPYKTYPTNRQAQMYREMLKDSSDNMPLMKEVVKQILNQRYTFSFFEYAAFPENITDIKNVIKSRKLLKEPWIITEKTTDSPMTPENPRDLDTVLNTNFVTTPDPSQIEFILKIKELCQKNNIELYFVSCCYPDCVIEGIPQFNELVSSVNSLFKQHDINFIDTYDKDFFPESTKNENFHDAWGHHVLKSKLEYCKSACTWIKEKGNF